MSEVRRDHHGSNGLVVLDASVLEASCLGPILRGQACPAVLAIREHGYTPAVLERTLAEVWSHAKLGRGNAAMWATPVAEFPGSIDRMVALIEQSTIGLTADDARQTAWLWFNLAEEWAGAPANLDEVQRQFVAWKQAMEAFCLRVESLLVARGVQVVSPWPQLASQGERQNAALLEREVALHSLLPSEDSAWIIDAMIVGARAIVSSDKGVVYCGRYSLGLNCAAPSVVHPTRLQDALSDGFGLAVYPTTG